MKQKIIWLVVISLCLSMAACANTDPTPTTAATNAPTTAPTQVPTQPPTDAPTAAPTGVPTEAPTQTPTQAPADVPTEAATQAPTDVPTEAATQAPTQAPTAAPTEAPTEDLSDPNATQLRTAQDVINAMADSSITACKLANDITVDLIAEPLRVNYTVELDLNGHTLTIHQPFIGNAISMEGFPGGTTLTIRDSSAAQIGKLRVVVTENGGGRDMFRVNIIGGHTNHVIILSGNFEYTAAEGITPNATLRFFNITNGNQTAMIMGGTFTGHTFVQLYNSTSATNGKKPSIMSGSFCVDPTDCIAYGRTVTQSGNMYIVNDNAGAPDDPSGGGNTDTTGYVEVSTVQHLLDAFATPFSGAYRLMNDITIPAEHPVKIFCSITLDLNGHVLTIEQNTANSNCISLQSDYEPGTLTIEDSSAAGTGVLRGLITAEGAGRSFIRVNVMSGVPNFFVLKSGTLEYTAAEGITSVNSKIILFHITQAEAAPCTGEDGEATIEGGKVVCDLPNAMWYNVGSALYGKKPDVYSVTSNLDPAEVAAEGKMVTTEVIDGQTWYQVS